MANKYGTIGQKLLNIYPNRPILEAIIETLDAFLFVLSSDMTSTVVSSWVMSEHLTSGGFVSSAPIQSRSDQAAGTE